MDKERVIFSLVNSQANVQRTKFITANIHSSIPPGQVSVAQESRIDPPVCQSACQGNETEAVPAVTKPREGWSQRR